MSPGGKTKAHSSVVSVRLSGELLGIVEKLRESDNRVPSVFLRLLLWRYGREFLKLPPEERNALFAQCAAESSSR